MGRLRPVPQTAPRALGLIRVSKERHGMVSPEIQRTAIEDYCATRGYTLESVIEGIDESGSRAKSAWWPRLDQAISAVEAHEYDVVVVWKFSRTARNRLKWAVAIDRVEAAGGALESATEQIDTTTPAGRFTRGMFAEMAAFEAERIGEGWRETHQRRVRAGLPPTGKPKWGYVYDQAAKVHRPDPETGPVLANLYRRYVAGESVYALVRWLNAHGHPTLTGGLWSDRTLRRVMDSGFAVGKFAYLGQLHDGVHEPVIGPKLWQAYLDARHARRAAPARRERSQYVLSGLVRCGRCGHPMVAGQFGNSREPKYRCKTGKEQGPAACSGGYVMATFVERLVVTWLTELAEDADEAHAASLAAKARQTTVRSDLTRLRRELARTEETLTRLAVQHAKHPLPVSVYAKSHSELVTQIEELSAAVEDAGRESRAMVPRPALAAKRLLDGWETWPVAHRRTELATLLAYVDVLTGRPRAQMTVHTVWGEIWAPPT